MHQEEHRSVISRGILEELHCALLANNSFTLMSTNSVLAVLKNVSKEYFARFRFDEFFLNRQQIVDTVVYAKRTFWGEMRMML